MLLLIQKQARFSGLFLMMISGLAVTAAFASPSHAVAKTVKSHAVAKIVKSARKGAAKQAPGVAPPPPPPMTGVVALPQRSGVDLAQLVFVPPPAPTAAQPAPKSPYGAGAHGYDASYPQCGTAERPGGAAYGVVGVNDGRSFTTNPCLASQGANAGADLSLYVNSEYDASLAANVPAACQTAGAQLKSPDDLRQAYAIGCSQAVYALDAAHNAGLGLPIAYWVDVESANAWDNNIFLNRAALQGEIDQLLARGRPVGLYANFNDWHNLTGNWNAAGVAADWVAGRTPDVGCTAGGFSGAPVWISQEVDTWGPGVDSDWAC